MEVIENKRQNNLDVLKCLCAFLVICIHIPYKGKFGEIVTPICRIAVPIFFMITGYFYTKTSKKPLKQIKKIFSLVILANLLYFLFGVLTNNLPDISNTNVIAKLILFNETPFAGHLWYLGAILYVLIIVYLADKIKIRKYLYFFIPILLIVDIIFGKYSILIFNKEFPYIYIRNFLFVGLPYFLIGDLLYKNKDKLLNKFSLKNLIILIIVFTITTLLEKYFLISINMNATRDQYISTTFLSITVFLLALKAKNVDDKFIFAIIGRKYSLYIYIVHLMIINLYNNYLVEKNILNYFIQIIVFLISLLIAIIYVKCKNIFVKKYKKLIEKGISH